MELELIVFGKLEQLEMRKSGAELGRSRSVQLQQDPDSGPVEWC